MAIALLVVSGRKKAAKLCLNAEDTEVVSGDQSDTDHLVAIRVNQTRLLHSLPGEAGENRVLIAKGNIRGIRERMHVIAVVGAEAATLYSKLNQLTRIVDRKQLQQNLIDQRKDSGIGANPECQRKNSGQRKSRFRAELPQAVSNVL